MAASLWPTDQPNGGVTDEETEAQRGEDFSDCAVSWQQNSGHPHPALSPQYQPFPLWKALGRKEVASWAAVAVKRSEGCPVSLYKVVLLPPCPDKSRGFGGLM